MDKILAVRNKDTGKYLTVNECDVFWAEKEVICWDEDYRAVLEDALKEGDEIVVFRKEPTEACERCEYYDHLPLCPWCGRRLS